MSEDQEKSLADNLNIDVSTVKNRVSALHELNPMLGHRGCRLGIAYPEITEMQARAILEASAELTKSGVSVLPEIMIPLVGTVTEYIDQEKVIRKVARDVMKEYELELKFMVGTMIELPRACSNGR